MENDGERLLLTHKEEDIMKTCHWEQKDIGKKYKKIN
jgi:hypothetical protein